MSNYTGCPCGCTTKLPWIDDPDCVRHLPLPLQVPSLRDILAEIYPSEVKAKDDGDD